MYLATQSRLASWRAARVAQGQVVLPHQAARRPARRPDPGRARRRASAVRRTRLDLRGFGLGVEQAEEARHRSGAGIDIELGVDVLEVLPHRARREPEQRAISAFVLPRATQASTSRSRAVRRASSDVSSRSRASAERSMLSCLRAALLDERPLRARCEPLLERRGKAPSRQSGKNSLRSRRAGADQLGKNSPRSRRAGSEANSIWPARPNRTTPLESSSTRARGRPAMPRGDVSSSPPARGERDAVGADRGRADRAR